MSKEIMYGLLVIGLFVVPVAAAGALMIRRERKWWRKRGRN